MFSSLSLITKSSLTFIPKNCPPKSCREKWQNIGAILQSKADLSSFILEVTKKLDMKYESPPMPVNLSASSALNIQGLFADEGNVDPQIGLQEANLETNFSADDLQEVAELFEVRK